MLHIVCVYTQMGDSPPRCVAPINTETRHYEIPPPRPPNQPRRRSPRRLPRSPQRRPNRRLQRRPQRRPNRRLQRRPQRRRSRRLPRRPQRHRSRRLRQKRLRLPRSRRKRSPHARRRAQRQTGVKRCAASSRGSTQSCCANAEKFGQWKWIWVSARGRTRHTGGEATREIRTTAKREIKRGRRDRTRAKRGGGAFCRR